MKEICSRSHLNATDFLEFPEDSEQRFEAPPRNASLLNRSGFLDENWYKNLKLLAAVNSDREKHSFQGRQLLTMSVSMK